MSKKKLLPIEPLLTTAQVAEILGVSTATVKRYYRAGKFPCVRVGRKMLFPRADIEAFITKNTYSFGG